MWRCRTCTPVSHMSLRLAWMGMLATRPWLPVHALCGSWIRGTPGGPCTPPCCLQTEIERGCFSAALAREVLDATPEVCFETLVCLHKVLVVARFVVYGHGPCCGMLLLCNWRVTMKGVLAQTSGQCRQIFMSLIQYPAFLLLVEGCHTITCI